MECSSHFKFASSLVASVTAGLLACACALPAAPAYAVTAAEKEAEAQEALNQLSAMQSTLEQASSKYYSSLAEYQAAKDKCDAAQKRIGEISKEIEKIQGRLGNRARDMYRSGAASFVDLLLGAASFEEFTNNWDLLNRMNTTDADLSSQARQLREETEQKKAEYTEQASIAEEKSKEANKAFKDSEELVKQMEATYNSLSTEAAALYAEEQAAAAAAAEAAAAEAAAGGDEGGYVVEGGYQNDDGTVTDATTGETYASAEEYTAATGNEIVDRAMAMLGASYRYGGTGADGSFDCSGLVGYALTGSYDRIGNTDTFLGYNQVDDPQPGDIVVNDGHTGIYIGDGQMIHAADEDTGVVIGKVQDGMIAVRP